MDHTVISVRGLGKRYHLGGSSKHDTLRDSLSHAAKGVWNLFRDSSPQDEAKAEEDSIIWSLRNVSFDVADGEVVGLIGRNGSGKSTLLKVISQITEPTEGEVRVRGRVASLLEVGTGFHPELTGRENIFLNGAILGMTRAEIMRKFDEMVAFAEVEKFLDTPVKRYSSGMYVRLAFAVAAQLEPEILVVDEVLAVGDAAFRQKCMGKMNDIAKGGRTVLFVSHNLAAVSQLCQRTIWLNAGQVVKVGQSDEVISAYMSELQKSGRQPAAWDREGTGRARFKKISLIDSRGNETDKVGMGDRMTLVLEGDHAEPNLNFNLWLGVFTNTGIGVLFAFDQDRLFSTSDKGEFQIRVSFPRVDLMPGNYSFNIRIGAWRIETLDFVRAALPFEVYQTAAVPVNAEVDQRNGLVYTFCEYEQSA